MALSLDARVRLLTGADNWRTAGDASVGAAADGVLRRPRRGARHRHGRARSVGQPAVPVGAGRDLGSRPGRGGRRGARRRSARQGHRRPAGPDHPPDAHAAGRPRLRVLLRGPACSPRGSPSPTSAACRAPGWPCAVKHFVCNDSETQRWTCDVRVAEHVLRELYLVPFEAVRPGGGRAGRDGRLQLRQRGDHDRERPRCCGTCSRTSGGSPAWCCPTGTRREAPRKPPRPGSTWPCLGRPGPGASGCPQRYEPAGSPRPTWTTRCGGYCTWPAGSAHWTARWAARRTSPGTVLWMGLSMARARGTAPAPGTGTEALVPSCTRRCCGGPRRRRSPCSATPGGCSPSTRTRRHAGRHRPECAGTPSPRAGAARPSTRSACPRPADALRAALAGRAQVIAEPGCITWEAVPEPPPCSLTDPDDGQPGMRLEFRAADGRLIAAEHRTATMFTWWEGLPDGHRLGRPGPDHAAGPVPRRPRRSAPDRRGRRRAAVALGRRNGPGRGHDPGPGRPGGGDGPARRDPGHRPAAGRAGGRDRGDPAAVGRGAGPGVDPARRRARARTRTRCWRRPSRRRAAPDAAIVIVGSAPTAESEGFDRPGLALPGRQDELVRRIVGGQRPDDRRRQRGHAGADAVGGRGRRGGVRLAGRPGHGRRPRRRAARRGGAGRTAAGHAAGRRGRLPGAARGPGDDGQLRYSEGLLIGYRGFDRAGTSPRFPFGHGLGYTTWALDSARGPARIGAGEDVEIAVVVRNTGTRRGREVVQAYVAAPAGAAAEDRSRGRAAAGPHAGRVRGGGRGAG